MNSHHQEHQTISSFASEADGHADKTMPLGVGDHLADGALDPLANASATKKLSAGSLVLVVVVVIACAGLWFMKSLSKVSAASGGNTEVEASIDKFLKNLETTKGKQSSSPVLNGGGASVLAVLSGSYTERQVPLENVQRNPFIIYGEAPVALTSGDDGYGRRRAERQSMFERAAAKLELKSVIMGSQPLANISGKIVRRGDELVAAGDGIAFQVTEILQDSVTLIAEDADVNYRSTFTLTLKR